jgi:hypothetical protein
MDFNWIADLLDEAGYHPLYLNNFSDEYMPVAGQISQPSLIVCQALKSDFQLNDLGRFSRHKKPGIKSVTSKSDAVWMINLI